MDATESVDTTWGRQVIDVDVRSLRRYNHLLDRLAIVGEALVIAGLCISGVGICWSLAYTNYENIIFYDGTDAPCFYDGSTGVISDGQ